MIQFQRSIWSESFDVYRRNIVVVGFYVGMMLVIIAVEEHLKHRGGLAFGVTFAAAYLALAAHLTVLTNQAGWKHLNDPEIVKRSQPFLWRTIGLSVLSLLAFFGALLLLMTQTSITTVFSIAIFVSLLSAPFIFAKWGTMLPAAAMASDSGFFRAGERGSVTFFYTLPRLFISIVLLSALLVGLDFVFASLNKLEGQLVSAQGVPNITLIMETALGLALSAFQIVMTAVILSRAYLIAEQNQAVIPSLSNSVA